MDHYEYRAVAFSGVRSFSGVATGGNRICAVLACTGHTIDTCGTRFSKYQENTTASFEELSIIAAVPTPAIEADVECHDSVFYPVALKPPIMPLQPKDYDYEIKTVGNVTDLKLSLKNLQSELYSFSVWGRVFVRDGLNATPPLPGASHRVLHSSIIIFAAVVIKFVV